MESKLADEAERALIEATQRMSPEERLNSFLVHCRLLMDLYEAGQKVQGSQPRPQIMRARRFDESVEASRFEMDQT